MRCVIPQRLGTHFSCHKMDLMTNPKTPPNPDGRVCAIVVTYNRKEMLRECLASLRAQNRPVDTVLVIDNASTDGTLALLSEEFDWCEVLPLETNSGGAGGFHAGMRWAYDQNFDWMWLMDDDGFPLPDCLQLLLEANGPDSVPVPLQKNKLGYTYGISQWTGTAVEVTAAVLANDLPRRGHYLFAFVGPLISRTIVENIGLPHHNFFIYFDDWEYALRIEKQTKAEVVVVPEAIFLHDIGGNARDCKLLWHVSVRVTPAPWKLYYGARNAVWTLKYGRRPRRELHKYLSYQARWMIGDVLYEPDRIARVSMRLRGIRDGLAARMGKRI